MGCGLLGHLSHLVDFPRVERAMSRSVIKVLLIVTYRFCGLSSLLNDLTERHLPRTDRRAHCRQEKGQDSVVVSSTAPTHGRTNEASRNRRVELSSAVHHESCNARNDVRAVFISTSRHRSVLNVNERVSFLPKARAIISNEIRTCSSLINARQYNSKSRNNITVLLVVIVVRQKVVGTVVTRQEVSSIRTATIDVFHDAYPMVLLNGTLNTFVLTSCRRVLHLEDRARVRVKHVNDRHERRRHTVFRLSRSVLKFEGRRVLRAHRLSFIRNEGLVRVRRSTVRCNCRRPLATVTAFIRSFTIRQLRLDVDYAVRSVTLTPLIRSVTRVQTRALACKVKDLRRLLPLNSRFRTFRLTGLLILISTSRRHVIPLTLPRGLSTDLNRLLFMDQDRKGINRVCEGTLTLASISKTLKRRFQETIRQGKHVIRIFVLRMGAVRLTFSAERERPVNLRGTDCLIVIDRRYRNKRGGYVGRRVSFRRLSMMQLLCYCVLI